MTNSIASKRREIANDRYNKLRLISKRVRVFKSSGHDYPWIANKVGLSESVVRTLHANPVM